MPTLSSLAFQFPLSDPAAEDVILREAGSERRSRGPRNVAVLQRLFSF